MTTRRWLGTLVFFLLAGDAVSASPPIVASPLWRPADSWVLAVDAFSVEQTDPKQDQARSFKIHVNVAGQLKVGPYDCWSVFFMPGPGSPQYLGKGQGLWVAKESSWPRKLERIQEKQDIDLVTLSEGTVLRGVPLGYPLEVFPLVEKGEFLGDADGSTLSLKSSRLGDKVTAEATVRSGGNNVRIVQEWVAGEKWWRQYTRFVDGKLDLRARNESTHLFKENQVSKVTMAPPSLCRDPKLLVRLDVDSRQATVAEVLDLLHRATGLEITIDPALAAHQPELGDWQLRKSTACMVMEMLANKDLENGRWVTVPNGYKLTGKSLLSPPPAASAPPSSPEGNLTWLWGSAVLVLLLGSGLAWGSYQLGKRHARR